MMLFFFIDNIGQPFYIRQLVLWRVKSDMIALGVRHNDLSSIARGNRYFETSESQQLNERFLSSDQRIAVGKQPNLTKYSLWYLTCASSKTIAN